jgi:hypothetical protein
VQTTDKYGVTREWAREEVAQRKTNGKIVQMFSRIHPDKGLNSSEPVLPPIMVNSPWTQPVVLGGAVRTFQNDAGRLHPQNFAGFLIDNLVDPLEDAIGTATIANHFRIKEQPAIAIAKVKSGEDFLPRLYLDKFTRLEVQLLHGSGGKGAFYMGIYNPFAHTLNTVKHFDQPGTKNFHPTEEKFQEFLGA